MNAHFAGVDDRFHRLPRHWKYEIDRVQVLALPEHLWLDMDHQELVRLSDQSGLRDLALVNRESVTLFNHFRWDGATGAFDAPDIVIPSGYHDALCQFIRDGSLPWSNQKLADRALRYAMKLEHTAHLESRGRLRRLIETPLFMVRRAEVYRGVRAYQSMVEWLEQK